MCLCVFVFHQVAVLFWSKREILFRCLILIELRGDQRRAVVAEHASSYFTQAGRSKVASSCDRHCTQFDILFNYFLNISRCVCVCIINSRSFVCDVCVFVCYCVGVLVCVCSCMCLCVFLSMFVPTEYNQQKLKMKTRTHARTHKHTHTNTHTHTHI